MGTKSLMNIREKTLADHDDIRQVDAHGWSLLNSGGKRRRLMKDEFTGNVGFPKAGSPGHIDKGAECEHVG